MDEACSKCGTSIPRNADTCPSCGELTRLGWRREREHRRAAVRRCTVDPQQTLLIIGMILLIVISVFGLMSPWGLMR